MTTTQLQLRRDTTANIDGITPAQGEPIYDVTRKALVLGDGATIGGNCVTPFGGTWTPGLQGTVANPTVTYSSQVGVWFQIGALVVAQGTIVISSLSGGSGSLQIDGLPVTAIAASVGSAGAGVI
ncbi:MAG TPA: hypothetical protein VL993_00090, partial [Stellaceae bacterium]|nr:hypothetical protein [Stellaceae bacterium]